MFATRIVLGLCFLVCHVFCGDESGTDTDACKAIEPSRVGSLYLQAAQSKTRFSASPTVNETNCGRLCDDLARTVLQNAESVDKSHHTCEHFCLDGGGCNCLTPWTERCKLRSCAACGACTVSTTTTTSLMASALTTATPTASTTSTNPICESIVRFDFGAACKTGEPYYDNLGGKGPQFADPEEIRFRGAGSYLGSPFDVVITATSDYEVPSNMVSQGCLGLFGMLLLRKAQQASFAVAFRDQATDALVSLPAFHWSFFDIDGPSDEWREAVRVTGFDSYSTQPGTYLDIESDGASDLWALASKPYRDPWIGKTNANNPTDPMALDDGQKKRAVAFHFTDTSSFEFELRSGIVGGGYEDHQAAAYFFAGGTNLLPCA